MSPTNQEHKHDAYCAWLTVPEAADHIKVNKTTMYRYIREKKLKVNRPGGTLVRICLEELNRLGEESSHV